MHCKETRGGKRREKAAATTTAPRSRDGRSTVELSKLAGCGAVKKGKEDGLLTGRHKREPQ